MMFKSERDRDTLINEAKLRNDIVPRARSEAAQMINQAQAYESEVVNRAKGDMTDFYQYILVTKLIQM